MQKDADLNAVNKSIKEQFRGEVKTSIQKNDSGLIILHLELKDTLTNHAFNSESGLPQRIVRSAFYSMSVKQRNSVDLIKITIANATGASYEGNYPIKNLIEDDSTRQIEYCSILPTISNQGLNIHLDEIPQKEFYRLSNAHTETSLDNTNHSDSLESILKLNFSDKFKFKDSCYFFNLDTDRILKFCRRTDPDNERSGEHYKLVDRLDEFIIFEVTRYEDWEFVVFDSNTGRAYSTAGYPKFSYSKKYMYSLTSYFGEAIISIQRLDDGKSITLSFDNWDALEDYWLNEEAIRFKLKSNICSQQNKYVDCHFIN